MVVVSHPHQPKDALQLFMGDSIVLKHIFFVCGRSVHQCSSSCRYRSGYGIGTKGVIRSSPIRQDYSCTIKGRVAVEYCFIQA